MKEVVNLQNPWWFGELLDTGYKRRNYTQKIIDQISKNILFVLGPRRVGKTFIIFQTIYELIDKGIKPQDICYLSLDNSSLSSINLLDYVTKNSFKYIFLDEVHLYPDWERILKNLYDLPTIKTKIIASGSSKAAIEVAEGFLTGRNRKIEVYPFDFGEFMDYRGDELTQVAIEKYLEIGGFPEYVDEEFPNYHDQLMRDLIDKDVLPEFRVYNPDDLLNLIKQVAKSLGHKTSNTKLGKSIGIDDTTIKRYLSIFRRLGVIYTINKYSESIREQSYADKKHYFVDNGLRNGLVGFADRGALAENLVHKHLRQYGNGDIFYYSDSRGNEIDFLLVRDDEVFLFESKYEEDRAAVEEALNNLFFTQDSRLKIKHRVVVTKSVSGEVIRKGIKAEMIPLDIFLQQREITG